MRDNSDTGLIIERPSEARKEQYEKAIETEVYGVAVDIMGGKESAARMMQWGRENLPESVMNGYMNRLEQPGESVAAAEGLKYRYQKAQHFGASQASADAGGFAIEEVRDGMRAARRGDVAAQRKLANTSIEIIKRALH